MRTLRVVSAGVSQSSSRGRFGRCTLSCIASTAMALGGVAVLGASVEGNGDPSTAEDHT